MQSVCPYNASYLTFSSALCPEMLTLLAKSTQVPCLLAWTGLASRKYRGEIKVWEEREVKVFILLVPFLLDPGLTRAVFIHLRPQPSTGSGNCFPQSLLLSAVTVFSVLSHSLLISFNPAHKFVRCLSIKGLQSCLLKAPFVF